MVSLTTGTGSMVLSALGWGFFGSFLFITVWFLQYQRNNNMKNNNMAEKCREVCRQRFWVMVVGLVIGVIPATWLSMTCGFRIGHFLFYLFFIVHGVYMAWPKKSMLDSTTSQEEVRAWIQRYRMIHLISMMGFTAGLVGSLVFMMVLSPKKTTVCAMLA